MERKATSHEIDEREERQEALRGLERDAGENYEPGFGKLLDDSPPAEIDDAEREDRKDR